MKLAAAFAVSVGISTAVGLAVEPIKQIQIYVEPYYHSADDLQTAPKVAVGKTFDALLSSTKRDDILAARDLIQKEPQRITPMTMMVLAIRCYDVSLRDDSVFWFYAAKERYFTMEEVLDCTSPQLFEAAQAIRSFAALAGPDINGYAFCDIAKQQAAKLKAVEWAEKNPFETLFLEAAPAKPGDRRENLKRAQEASRERMNKEKEYLANPENVAQLQKTREENDAKQKYCWEDEK